jgi:hypothetical protein
MQHLLLFFIHLLRWDGAVSIATWLRAGQLKGQSLSPGRVKNFLFSMSSRPILGPTQLPIQWVSGGSFPGGKAAGA